MLRASSDLFFALIRIKFNPFQGVDQIQEKMGSIIIEM